MIPKVRVLRLVDPLLIRKRMPVRSVALNDKVSAGQVEVHSVPLERRLLFVWLAKEIEDSFRRCLQAAGPDVLRQRGRTPSRACTEAADERRLHHANGTAHLTRHPHPGFMEGMIGASDRPTVFGVTVFRAMLSVSDVIRVHLERLVAPLTDQRDLRLPLAAPLSTISFVESGKPAFTGAVFPTSFCEPAKWSMEGISASLTGRIRGIFGLCHGVTPNQSFGGAVLREPASSPGLLRALSIPDFRAVMGIIGIVVPLSKATFHIESDHPRGSACMIPIVSEED